MCLNYIYIYAIPLCRFRIFRGFQPISSSNAKLKKKKFTRNWHSDTFKLILVSRLPCRLTDYIDLFFHCIITFISTFANCRNKIFWLFLKNILIYLSFFKALKSERRDVLRYNRGLRFAPQTTFKHTRNSYESRCIINRLQGTMNQRTSIYNVCTMTNKDLLFQRNWISPGARENRFSHITF